MVADASQSLTVASKVSERQRGLTLYLQALAFHQGNETLYKLRLGLCELLSVITLGILTREKTHNRDAYRPPRYCLRQSCSSTGRRYRAS